MIRFLEPRASFDRITELIYLGSRIATLDDFHRLMTTNEIFRGRAIGVGILTPEDAIKGWMGSPGHRANILQKNTREIGLGIARDDGGTVYYTAVFSVQRKP